MAICISRITCLGFVLKTLEHMSFNMLYLSVRRSSSLGSGSVDIEIASHHSSSTLYFASSLSNVFIECSAGTSRFKYNLLRQLNVLVNDG